MYRRSTARLISVRFVVLLSLCLNWEFIRHTAFSQERPLESLAGPEAARRERDAQLQEPGYDIQYGNLKLRAEAKAGAEFNDNVFYSYGDRRQDYILRPEVNLSALLPITELNSLRMQLGIGYDFYFKNSELNGNAPLINPGSELAWNIFVGDFHIRFYDRFFYQETLAQDFFSTSYEFYNLNNVGKFSRLDNNVGILADWDLNNVVLTAGFDHENFNSKTAEFDYLDRATELFTAQAAFKIDDNAKAGLEGRFSWTDYRENRLDDNWGTRVGPFADVAITEYLSVRAGGGYETFQYDNPPGINNDLSTYYAYAQVAHKIHSSLTQRLEVGHENQLGINADHVETTYIRHHLDWKIARYLTLETVLGAQFADESGTGFSEQFNYYLVGANVEYQLARKWRANLGYYLTYKDSELAFTDFAQNRVKLDVTYQF